ncbi:MAG: flagellar hook-basal body complex protein FliE [Turneriella sp.]|nr:flagellar hook-basal body complex protein FliE [Leptospiraceae bacterium]MCX7632932.1 flagellar hook-basal body complex protein FliE [Turneriella sp.]
MLPITENFFHQDNVKGDLVVLRTTDPRHHDGRPVRLMEEDTALNFSEVLVRALEKVNEQQVNAETLGHRLVADPKGISAHTLIIQAEKARMSLTLVKNIADLAVRTYRELSNLR